MSLILHHSPGTAGMAPHIVLEDLGVPFALEIVDREHRAHKSPAYLALNPNGLIPVLVDGDLVLYETAAIVLHLADTHAAASLAPPLGSAERAHFYKWLAWLTNTVQATMLSYFYPERSVDEGNAEGVRQVKAHAEARLGGLFDLLDGEFARHGGPWLLGAHYTVLDPYAFMLGRWSRHFARPARTRAHLGPFLERMLARPAVQRVLATERLPQPWI